MSLTQTQIADLQQCWTMFNSALAAFVRACRRHDEGAAAHTTEATINRLRDVERKRSVKFANARTELKSAYRKHCGQRGADLLEAYLRAWQTYEGSGHTHVSLGTPIPQSLRAPSGSGAAALARVRQDLNALTDGVRVA